MITLRDVDAIVIDIEGTTSKTSHVFDVLFPYARARFGQWIAEHAGEQLELVRKQTADTICGAVLNDTQLVAQLEQWSDLDIKAPALKTVQGEIWAEGFARGELVSQLFDDVAPALQAWKSAGKQLYVFSSGSITAQRSWFSHTPAGDLTELFSDYFDTVNAGNKREADSYRAIAAAIDVAPERILFLTDVVEEIAAARAADWNALGVVRDGEPQADRTEKSGHQFVRSFTEVQ